MTEIRRAIRRGWWRFGRTYRTSILVVRVMLLIETALILGLASWPTHFTVVHLLIAAWALFAAVDLVLPLLAWHRAIFFQPVFAVVDWATVAIVLIGHLVVSPLMLIFIPLLIADGRLRPPFRGVAIIFVIALAVALGASIGTAEHLHSGRNLNFYQPAIVVVAALVIANWFAREDWRNELRVWSEQLLIDVANNSENLDEAVLHRLHAAYGSADIIWLANGEGAQGILPGPTFLFPLPGAQSGQAGLTDEIAGSMAFAYERGRARTVYMSAQRQVRAATAPVLGEAIAGDERAQKRGTGGIVRLGQGGVAFFLIPSTLGPTKESLEETLERALIVIAAFDRSVQLEAWQHKNFTAARMAASRDLHDSVLQTLASVRMRISTLLAKARDPSHEAIRAGIADLQAIVSDEQLRLRALIEAAQIEATAARDLNEIIANTVDAVCAQWMVECDFSPMHDSVLVDENTSNQCDHIIREVVSNAVRHGRASRFWIRTSIDDETLMIAVRDDSASGGIGNDAEISSKSVLGRLAYTGGSAYVDRVESGAIVSIRIPLIRGS